MFYSVPFLYQYSTDHKIPISEIPDTAIPELVQSVHGRSYFNKKEIRDGFYTYCFVVANIRPNWITKKE